MCEVRERWRIVGLSKGVWPWFHINGHLMQKVMVTWTKHHYKSTQDRVTIQTKFMNIIPSSAIYFSWLIFSKPKYPIEGWKISVSSLVSITNIIELLMMYFLAKSRLRICMKTWFRISTEVDIYLPSYLKVFLPQMSSSQDDNQEFSSLFRQSPKWRT